MDDQENEDSLWSVQFDLMSAMVFVLIIVLIAYVLNFTSNFDLRQDTAQELSEAEARRSYIVDRVSAQLRRHGVDHEKRPREGLIVFRENAISFGSGSADLDPNSRQTVRRTAAALAAVLPCYTDLSEERAEAQSCTSDQINQLRHITVEGHTDNIPMRSGGSIEDNLALSLLRAAAVVRELESHDPLMNLETEGHEAIFSAAGYGERRPLVRHSEPTSDQRNRRIELRFTLRGPNLF